MSRLLFPLYVAVLLALGLTLWSWIFATLYRAMQP